MTVTQSTEDQHHPVVIAQKTNRAADAQLRAADAITKFAGSMMFVWIHIALFAFWIVLLGYAVNVDPFPFGFLTMIVSLEAIFLSTFVMIGQNRQAEFTQRKADHDYLAEEAELHLNTELTKAIHVLAQEIHAQVVRPAAR